MPEVFLPGESGSVEARLHNEGRFSGPSLRLDLETNWFLQVNRRGFFYSLAKIFLLGKVCN